VSAAETPNLNAIGQLVQRLAEQSPQQWCLIAPSGLCWIGPDPLALAAQAAYSVTLVSPTPATKREAE
jgi:hypothetical protein